MQSDGALAATRIDLASCPACDEDVEVPAGARPGDLLQHCGTAYRLTYGYGSWALEPVDAPPEGDGR